jgi:hypothetical protein
MGDIATIRSHPRVSIAPNPSSVDISRKLNAKPFVIMTLTLLTDLCENSGSTARKHPTGSELNQRLERLATRMFESHKYRSMRH